MVKLSGAKADRWIESPNPSHWAALLYGPNQGLVRDRAESLVAFLSGREIDDPFAVVGIDGARLQNERSAITDEAFSQSLLGGSKVVWLKESSDKNTAVFDALLGSSQIPNPLVVEAGDLPSRSRLRSLFEKADNAVAIGCYEDDPSALRALIGKKFREFSINAGQSAIETLVSRLGKDRLANLSEIDKVCLYVGQERSLSEEMVLLAIGEGGGFSVDELVYTIFDGGRDLADQLLNSSINEGLMPVQFIRRLQSHTERLLSTRTLIDQGVATDRAMSELRPPVFFKFKNRFRNQVQYWPAAKLQKCLAAMIDLEIECKSTGMPDVALCQRMGLSVSGLAKKLAR